MRVRVKLLAQEIGVDLVASGQLSSTSCKPVVRAEANKVVLANLTRARMIQQKAENTVKRFLFQGPSTGTIIITYI